MPDDELTKQLIEAKFSVYDRMVEAGWISQMARTDTSASVLLTPKGEAIVTEIRSLLFGAEPMNPTQCTAFISILRNLHQAE